MDALIVLLCFFCASPQAVSKSDRSHTGTEWERYVSPSGNDRNDGSRAHPWATIGAASARVKPGTTVHVAAGTYGTVVTPNSGTPGARIRYISDVKWGARIRSVGSYSAWTNNGDYVDIIGFDVSGTGNLGIVNWGSGVRIVANHVHNVLAPGCPQAGGAGIVNANYTARDNEIIGNVVHDIGDLTKLCARVHGIYHSNVHGRVVNNISYRNEGFGIHLWHAASDVTIANNLVFNNYYGGILIGAGDAPYHDDPSHPADNILVINNIVVFNLNRFGMEEMGLTARIRYVSNLVYKNQSADWRLKTGRQMGTISADPKFVNYSPEGYGDYHLRPGSPAIAAGSNVDAPRFDIDGAERRQVIDLGPYQFDAASNSRWPPVSDDAY